MRNAFIKKLTELANQDKDLYLITADTGFKVLDQFKDMFSERYLNIGISEPAMISVASGLALSGKHVFVYAIVPFISMRCFEQIRDDLCYQNLPVKLIGIGGGLTYGTGGVTHHSIEDIAIMNSLPNMTVVCPGDPREVEMAIEAISRLRGPVYLRLGKSGEKVLHKEAALSFEIGKGIRMREGKELAIIATGNMLETAVNACEILADKGKQPELISMHTIKPIDRELITNISASCRLIVTIEEHSIIGGLGSRVADVITEESLRVDLKKFAIPDRYAEIAGSRDYLKKYFGLTAEQIAENLLTL